MDELFPTWIQLQRAGTHVNASGRSSPEKTSWGQTPAMREYKGLFQRVLIIKLAWFDASKKLSKFANVSRVRSMTFFLGGLCRRCKVRFWPVLHGLLLLHALQGQSSRMGLRDHYSAKGLWSLFEQGMRCPGWRGELTLLGREFNPASLVALSSLRASIISPFAGSRKLFECSIPPCVGKSHPLGQSKEGDGQWLV